MNPLVRGYTIPNCGQYCARAWLPVTFRGQVTMVASRPDGFITTREAADLIQVSRETISAWRRLGYLAPQGLDERGYPLHTPEAVRAAEKRVQEHGIARGGYDPRRLRGRNREPAATQAETEIAA